MNRSVIKGVLGAVVLAGMMGASLGMALASNLEFRGQNVALFPSANASSLSGMMNSVHRPTASTTSLGLTPASLIVQALESQISTRIYNDMFNGTATAGTYNLGGGNLISYTKGGGLITITITDPVNGTTVISVPSA